MVFSSMEIEASKQSYSRQTFSLAFIALGIIVLLSGLIVNPWVGRLYRENMINYQNVMLNYFIWAVVISSVIVGLGIIIRITSSSMIGKVALLSTTCLLIVLADRLLLATLGLGLWMADIENNYVHRPNTIRTWGYEYNNKLIRINQYGHHDDDFPLEKRGNEFRGLIIGDSVTMGHGVTREETFSNQLENILREKNNNYEFYQIINAGVQGYSTYQEYNLLKRSLRFNPDFIAIGFCMNDLTEPYVIDKNFGGVGLDYHGVAQSSFAFASYLLNETGYGRCLQRIRRLFLSVETEIRSEIQSLRKIARSSVDNPAFTENWKSVLFNIDKIYEIAKNNNVRVVLLIFPDTYQLMNYEFQEPQRILISHAKSKNIDVIDFTDVFGKVIFHENVVKLLTDSGYSFDEIHALYNEARIPKYFLDQSHLTVEGHKVVSSQLYAYLLSHNFMKGGDGPPINEVETNH